MFQNKLLLWQVVFITSLLTSNVIAGKVVLLFGYLTVPAAVLAYALTFLATDVINELYGKETANEIVRIGFLAQLLAAGLIYLATLMPVAPFMPENAGCIPGGAGTELAFCTGEPYRLCGVSDSRRVRVSLLATADEE